MNKAEDLAALTFSRGKEYLTIYNFVDAYQHFSDPEWDGEAIAPEELALDLLKFLIDRDVEPTLAKEMAEQEFPRVILLGDVRKKSW